ncbi:putative long tail fiber protein [Alteromonas phage vB_AmeP_R8W]|uniref:Putative long tail fiber protein n=1 Tax=Alteromonas phage vB_AmeP_R8W TaxID=2774152 RepID=A0A8E4RFZ3_9CAUD|nr:putative long tail fiber protein [Alteromonas phage vB_AmeP_R8W]
MANTLFKYTGNGVRTVYPASFSLGYLRKEDIYVYTGANTEFNENGIPFSWVGDNQIELDEPVEFGTELTIRRVVNRTQAINNYEEGAILRESNLDASFAQALMILEELADGFFDPLNDNGFGGGSLDYVPTKDLDMNGFSILNADVVEANSFLHSRVGDLVDYINERTADTVDDSIRTDILLNEDGLIVNAFHDVLGRQGYFPSEAGTSEGQFLLIRAAILSFQSTNDYKWLAIAFKLKSNIDKLYLKPPPEDPNELYIPHWLFIVKKAVEMQSSDNALKVTMVKDSEGLNYVGQITPSVIKVVENPDTVETPIVTEPVYDQELPEPIISATSSDLQLVSSSGRTIDDVIASGDLAIDGEATVTNVTEVDYNKTTQPLVTIEGQRGELVLRVVRAYSTDADTRLDFNNPFAGVIGTDYGAPSAVFTSDEFGTVFHIPVNQFPEDTPNTIEVNVIAIFDFGETAEVSENIEAWPHWRILEETEISCAVDTLPWAYEAFDLLEQTVSDDKYTLAKNATAANIYNVFDVDDGRPWIKPFKGNPTDMSGTYFFSTREGFTVDSISQGENLSTRIEVPAGSGEAQYGRGVVDEVKVQDTGVLLDWDIDNLGSSTIRVFIQKGPKETTATRYYYDVNSSNTANNFSGEMEITWDKFVPYRLGGNGWFEVIDPIVDLQDIDVVGFVVETPDAVSFTVRRFRPVPEITLPYTPHVAPFTANAIEGQIIDWRGGAGIGYQDPVIWAKLGNTAGLSGMLQFLEDSQAEYASRYNDDGLFMPAYVWDRFDRGSVTTAPIDTWTFDWVDPNTEWVGYNARCVASCAEAGDIVAQSDPTNSARALTIANKFMTLIRNAWTDPNKYPPTNFPESITELTRSTYYEKGERVSKYDGFMYEALSSGTTSATDFQFPTEIGATQVDGTIAFKCIGYTYTQSPVYGNYEEPHAVALFMRAACYLYRNGIDTASNLAFIQQGWTYLERLWADAQNYEALRNTWSGNPSAGEYFGFWTGEIVTILAKLLNEFDDIRQTAGISSSDIKDRLAKHAEWIVAATRGGIEDAGFLALALIADDLNINIEDLTGRVEVLEQGGSGTPTAEEVKTLYESNADTNAFTDAEQTKLADAYAGGDLLVNGDFSVELTTSKFASIRRAVNSSQGAILEYRRSRGTLETPTASQDFDNLGGMYAYGYDGVDYQLTAGFTYYVDGVVAENAVPTGFKLFTSPDVVANAKNRFIVKPNGNIQFMESDGTTVGVEWDAVGKRLSVAGAGVITSEVPIYDNWQDIPLEFRGYCRVKSNATDRPLGLPNRSFECITYGADRNFLVISQAITPSEMFNVYRAPTGEYEVQAKISDSKGKSYVDVTSGDVVLSALDSDVPVLQIGGTPTVSSTVTLSALTRMWVVTNDSTQGVTLSTGNGGTVFVEAGYQSVVFGDGVGIRQSMTIATNGLKMNGDLILPIYSVATLPDPTTRYMVAVGCTDGDSGSPCLAVSDGGSWKRVALGATVSAT